MDRRVSPESKVRVSNIWKEGKQPARKRKERKGKGRKGRRKKEKEGRDGGREKGAKEKKAEGMARMWRWEPLCPVRGMWLERSRMDKSTDGPQNHTQNYHVKQQLRFQVYLFKRKRKLTAKTWTQSKCPSTDDGYRRCSVKNNEILPSAATWMDWEAIRLSKWVRKKDKYLIISLIYGTFKNTWTRYN